MKVRFQSTWRASGLSLFICTLMLTLFVSMANAQHFTPIEKGSKIEFTAVRKGSKAVTVRGTIGKVSGNITFDPKQLNKASFDITLDANTVKTGDLTRDNDLKGFSFFNSSQYPKIHFVSRSVTQDRPGSIVYLIAGNLTMKGTTKPVKMQFTIDKTGQSYKFRGLLNVSRLDFRVGEHDDIDDNVSVFIEVATK